MPSTMYQFICYWRSRGMSMRSAYRLWSTTGYSVGGSNVRTHLTPSDYRYANQ